MYKKGWKGINIDLNQTSIDLFNIFRPRDKNICAAISNKEEKVKVKIENIFSPLNKIYVDSLQKIDLHNLKTKNYYVKTKKFTDLSKKI